MVAVLALVTAGVSGVVSVAQVATAPEAAAAIGNNPQDEALALAQAKASGRRVEVVSEREEMSTIWANPDGTLTDERTSTPVRIKQTDGSWAPVDLSLATSAGRLAPSVSSAAVSFSDDGDGQLATLDTAGKTSFSLAFAGAVDAPKIEAGAATYPVSGPDPSAVTVAATPNGFTARVVLAQAPTTAPTYTFPLTLNGLKASLDHDVLTLADQDGTVVARSAPLSMWDSRVDAAGDRAEQVPVDAELVTTATGGTDLVLTPSMDWLTAATTKYPVTVDPDVSTVSMYGDTYVSSGATGTNYYTDYRIRVGSDDGTTKYRGIETFKTADYNGKDISSATLKMYQYYGATCTAKTTNVYPTVSRIPTTTVTWANQAAATTDAQWSSSSAYNTGNSAAGCPTDAWVNMDVSKMVNGQTAGEIANGSFELQNLNELDDLGDKRFCSANPQDDPGNSPCSVASLQPVLSLSYWPSLGTQKWYSSTSHPLNDRSTLLINNDNGNAVIQAQDVKLNGNGLDLGIDRFYNSQGTDTTSLGTGGWSLSVGPDVFLEAGTGNYRYDYHAPGGTHFGQFVRKSTTTTAADYKKFYAPVYGGLDAELTDDGNDSNGLSTFTMTFHSSQQKYVFKKVDTSSNNLYLAQMKDRSDNVITFNYASGTHTLTSITDTESRSITFTYTSGRITQITSTTKASDGTTDVTRAWKYGYTGSQLTSYTDPALKTVTYGYTSGVITTITDPVNASGSAPTTTLTYWTGNAAKQVTYSRAAGDVAFSFQYFTAGGGTSICPGTPDRWSKVTDLTSGDDALNKGPTYCFTDRHDANTSIHVVDALGHDKGSTYTADNQGDTSTTAGNAGGTDGSTVSTYAADLNDQLSSVTEPKDSSDDTPGTTTFDYANASSVAGGKWLPTSSSNPSGNCNGYGYDSKGRTSDSYTGFSSTTGASGCAGGNTGTGVAHFHKEYNDDGSIKYSYDGNGSATAATSSTALDSQRTDFTYWATTDANYVPGTSGQLKTVVKPGGNCTASVRHLCTSYAYNGAGQVFSVTDGRSKVTRYSYDDLDRVTALRFNGVTTCTTTDISAGNCIVYGYDAEGNMTSRTEQAGKTTFTYDRMNRQLSQAFPGGNSVSWTTDGAGNKKTYQQSVAGTVDTVTYTYDTANRPSTVVDSTGTFSIQTDADGRPSQISYPLSTGVIASYDYTKSGKPHTIAYVKAGSGNVLSYTYSYKDGTKQTGKLQTEDVTGISALTGKFAYSYNKSDQLTGASNDSGDDFTYAYDKGSNLTKATTNASTTSTYNGYDRAGELCWTGTGTAAPSSQLGTACPTTPSSGYTARTSDHAGNNLGTSANPNAYNGNSQATTVGGVAQSYLDLGNNLRITVGGNSTLNGPLGVTARTTSSGTTFYTRDSSGTILGAHGYSAARYYLADYQGSVSALISTAGAVVGSYAYDPYGKTTANAETGGTTAADNPWRYIGGYYDTEGDGNYHLAARYYDGAGHFTQPDAVQGSISKPSTMNSYGYSGGDPVNHADPSGKTYVGADFSACIFACLTLGAGVQDGGQYYLSLGAAAGGDLGADGGVSAGTGTNSGWQVSGSCTAATPIGGGNVQGSIGEGGSVSGGGGISYGLEAGCRAGPSYTWTT
jgi:RHS repeat-associated protein